MTEQDAIKRLEFLNDALNFNRADSDESSCALQMGMEALEKQIPKKVNLRHIRKYDGFDGGECPTCGNSVLRDGFSYDVYCDECGQKLDWSDEDE